MPAWLSEFLPILLLLAAVTIVMVRLPKIELGHSAAFLTRRRWNWLPLGLTYAFLYMGRYNLKISKFAFENMKNDQGGALMGNDAFAMIFFVGTIVYGVSFLVVLVNAGLFATARALVRGDAGRRTLVEVLLVSAVLWSVLGYGYWRLDGLRALETEGNPLRVALIQGNIDQERKWNRDFQAETIGIYDDLSREAAREGADLIVWPETAAPFYFQSDARMGPPVRKVARDLEAHLLFGAPAFQYGASGTQYLNRAYQVDPDGNNAGHYDKLNLVLFGEYNPIPFITKLVEGAGDFTPGKEVTTFHHPAGDYGVMICYEAIFSGLVRRFVARGARFLVNITNDAWFGDTSAPYQHLSMVAFRAVENRVPVVRAANTGITAVIAIDGSVTAQTGLFERTWLTRTIRITDRTTFYARWGDIFVWLTTAFALLLLLWSFVLKYRSR